MSKLRWKLVIFDKDGTICQNRHDPSGFINSLDDQGVMPDVEDKLKTWRASYKDVVFGIASNQGGVPMGYMTEGEAWLILYHAAVHIGAAHNMTLMCIDHPDEGSFFRKPRPGMLLRLMVEGRAQPNETLFVGDRDEDYQAARRAGCHFLWAWEFFEREPPDGWEPPDPDEGEGYFSEH